MQENQAHLQQCIEACLDCYRTCLGTAMTHCLESGGKHVEPDHFRLMSACAETCQAAASLMLIGAPQHRQLCGLCAEICDACAADCERIGDMEDCVRACRSCAESCRAMAA